MPHDVDSVTFRLSPDRRQTSDRRAHWRGGRRSTDARSMPDLAVRIMGEYDEQPGMRLTLAQAARLWRIPLEACGLVLEGLVLQGRLTQTLGGRYMALPRVGRPLVATLLIARQATRGV